ncbi:MAG: hypothetical protein E7089_08820 [Bacteroidales bacterium]|nr:hypothetical protein [Bacteroidales bacterium]MBR2607154.1 hypothetical protein [Bacteroidaceae bacterium]
MTNKELTKKVQEFCAQLETEGVKYVFLSKNNEEYGVKSECTAGEFYEMLSEMASRLTHDNAGFIGAHITAVGLAVLKTHDKELLESVKKNMANI